MSNDRSICHLVPEDKCCGCQNCVELCPKKAIRLKEVDGFNYPVVDSEKCINCGVCTLKCPIVNKTIKANSPLRGYGAWNSNKSIRINSTSGGLYYSLGKIILSQGGYICGCSFTDDYHGAIHIIGNNIQTLNKTMRSKYFQSDINGVYGIIKQKLEDNNKVLFVGTPCQCKALQLYLGKEYNELIICDFVCRGVNSPKAYSSFIRTLEQRFKSRAVAVHFKNKKNGWNALSTRVDFENKKTYLADKYSDPWVNGYIRGHLYMRECCYDCPYATVERYSDISIGDFWGYKSRNPELDFTGISCVLINTEKGQLAFEAAKTHGLKVESVDINDIVRGNGCLNGAKVKIPENRGAFFARCEKEDFDRLVFELLGFTRETKTKNLFRKYYYKAKNFMKYPEAFSVRKKILNSEVLLHGNNHWD